MPIKPPSEKSLFMQKVEYVAGFLFNEEGDHVCLIEKQRPAWQRGKLNAIGGHIEVGETPEQAMSREFLEETGVIVSADEWRHFVTLTGQSDVLWTVYFFCAFDTLSFVVTRNNQPTTDEWFAGYAVKQLEFERTIPNLRWLIPMAQSMRFESAERFTVTEHYRSAEAIV